MKKIVTDLSSETDSKTIQSHTNLAYANSNATNSAQLNIEAEIASPTTSSGMKTTACVVYVFIQFSIDDGEASAWDVFEHIAKMQKCLLTAKNEMDKLTRVGAALKSSEIIRKSIVQSLEHMSNAIVGLQFFDRVSQRLSHAMHCMESLHSDLKNVDDVEAVQHHRLMNLYKELSMEDERRLFESIQQGSSLKQALKNANKELQALMSNSKIELF